MSSDWMTVLQSLSWDAAIKIVLAAVLGAVVGLEREWGGHPAGLRTNMMIAISSSLFTLLSIGAFPAEGSGRDTARVAAQIVTGVGFLGAGVVLQTRKHIRGLTTGATIWLVAAIGMAVGTGAYFVAIFTTTLSTVSLILLAPISVRLEQRALEREEEEAARKKRAAKMSKNDKAKD